MNTKNLKKLVTGVTFAGLLFLNVPVYANVAPTVPPAEEIVTEVTETVDTTASETTATTEAEASVEATTTEADVTAETTTDTSVTDTTVTTDAEATTTETTETTEAEVTTTEATDATVTEETEEVDPGIAPDSALYVLDKLLEDIQISLTFDDVNKAALLTSISEERIAEINYLLEVAETEEVNQEEWDQLVADVIADYKEKLESALESIEGVAIELTDEEKAELDSILLQLENTTTIIDEDVVEADEEVQELVDRSILVAAVVSDLDKEKVAEIREQGLGLGQISQVFALAEATGKSVDEVSVLFTEQGMGYGQAAKELGVHPSELAKDKKNKKNATEEAVTDEVTTETEAVEATTEADTTVVETDEVTTTETEVTTSVETKQKPEQKVEANKGKSEEKKNDASNKKEDKGNSDKNN